jgi:hypothetical protein
MQKYTHGVEACVSSRSSLLVPLFSIVCACPRYLVVLVWPSLMLVGCRLCSFGFRLCLFSFCSYSFGFVCARLVVVRTRLCLSHRSPVPTHLAFILACPCILWLCTLALCSFGLVWVCLGSFLCVKYTHSTQIIIKKLTF